MAIIDKLEVLVNYDEQHLLGCNIERPEPGTTSIFANFFIGGWALACNLQPLMIKIIDTTSGLVVGKGQCNIPRPDVADFYCDLDRAKAINCCFAVSVDTRNLPANFELKVTAIPLDNKKETNEDWELGFVKGHQELTNTIIASSKSSNRSKKGKMVIFDNFYPNLLTNFRQTEFNYYLDNIEAEVYTYHPNFEQFWQEFITSYPQYKQKVKAFNSDRLYKCTLFYTVFLNNIYDFLPYIEREETPFIFTLYPGGGFELNEERSDNRLRKICSSPLLRQVIVTQRITADYLITNSFCPPEKIKLIFGVALPLNYYLRHLQFKKQFGIDKETFDICFVANKYMPQGRDKGYDTFIKVAENLVSLNPVASFRFHVVGNFTEEDIDVTKIKPYIKFYGSQNLEFFSTFYCRMDLILSPNIPFKLKPGGFDGFPTGCCVEAAINGVGIMCTDILQMNDLFIPEKELSIISPNVADIVERIIHYRANLAVLYKMSKAGQKRCFKLFSEKYQLNSRLKLINKFL